MTDREAQCPTKEGCWTSDKEKELDNLKDQLDKLQQAMVTLLTANKDKKDENSKLQERIQQVQRDFEKKANACDRLSIEMCEKKEEISLLLQEKERVLQISERLKEKEKNDKLLQEHIGKLRNELQEKEEKVEDLSQKLDEGTKDIKRLNNSLQTNEQERVKREKMINNYIDTMNKELEILRENIKEKDSNISQLVKVTDQRLAYCYPDEPAKIGERWASLYTDEWTDFFEDLTEQNKRQGNTNELPEKQLIKIVDWCYKRCLEIAKEQNNKIHETLWEVVRFIHFLGAKPKEVEQNKLVQCNIDTEDKMMIAAMTTFEEKAKIQLQCSTTLIDAVRKQCCDDYISSNPDSLASAKHFIMKCSELCWHALSSNPPMAIDYENFEEQAMDPNKFNKYNRSGTTVEYVVWPALLLHKDGPVLAKGTVQTNYEEKTAPRKKSADNIFTPPKPCKPTDTLTTKDDITSDKILDPVQCTKDALEGDSHANDSGLKLTKPNNKDPLNDLSQKGDFKSINPIFNSEKEKEKEFSVDPSKQASPHTEQDVKPECALKTGDAENIDQSCRCLGKKGESINEKITEGSSGVTTEGSKEIKNETSNSAIGNKNIGDKMEETNKNGVKNEFENSSNKVTEHQSKSKNQYENISIKKSHTTRDRQEMKGDELNISVHKGVKTQTEVMDAVDSKPHDDKYEPEPFSLDGSINPPTHSWESNTDDKYESPGNNQTVNANDGIPDSPTVSNIESKIKFYSKEGNQLNGPHQRTGTIQRELDKVRKRSKLPKDKDFNKTKPESKTSRKNSSN
ncbi:uncharacterized protein LOC143041953 isoform X2 [Mytilus galloprovincialis]|uniref:uncharacterized protein LOC143041953 isoform X2 n=1 Tax=Mytilus galloprovincialis TaxID=29158 RepID=UPI003F7C7FA4